MKYKNDINKWEYYQQARVFCSFDKCDKVLINFFKHQIVSSRFHKYTSYYQVRGEPLGQEGARQLPHRHGAHCQAGAELPGVLLLHICN